MKNRIIALVVEIELLLFSFLAAGPYSEPMNPFEQIQSMGRDSLNVRFVGNWPFSWGDAVAYDSTRDLAFSASGGGVYILDCTDPLNPVEVSDLIRTRGFVKGLSYDEATQRLYIANDRAGLEIWDVANPSTPYKLGSYDTKENTNDLAVEDTLVYLADGEAGLKVLDISDPMNPMKIGELDTPGSAEGVFVSDSFAYIADRYSGVRVIDVSTPSNPVEIGMFLSDTLDFHDVYISDTLAYVASNSLDYEGRFLVLHIADPANPILLGACTISSVIRMVHVYGSYAYLGNNPFFIVDISTPSNPYEVGFIDIGATDMDISGSFAYVSSDTFRIMDISTPPNPIVISSYDTGGIWTNAVAVSGSFAYAVDYYGTFWIIDISNPAIPQDMGHCTTYSHNQNIDIFIKEPYAYVVNGAEHIIIDISYPANPYIVGSTHMPGGPTGIHVIDTLAFIADGGRLRVQNVADPSNPHGIGNCVISGGARRVFATESHAYVVSYSEGLKIIDVTDPANPQQIGFLNLVGPNTDIFVSGIYAYLSSVSNRFRIVDISDPQNPIGIGSLHINGYSVVVSGSHAFLSDWPRIHVVDVSDPDNPIRIGYYEVPSGGSPCNLDVKENLIVRACGKCAIQMYELIDPMSIKENDEILKHPKKFKLLQNPIKGNYIELLLLSPEHSNAEITLYNQIGQRLKTYQFNGMKSGESRLRLDAKDLPSGIYFLKLNSRPVGKVVKVR